MIKFFKVVRQPANNAIAQSRIERIKPIIVDAAHDWSPAKMTQFIRAREVPDSYIDSIISHLRSDPGLIVVQKEEFLATVEVVYPELHSLLTSKEGDAWLELCFDKLRSKLVFSVLNFLRGS